MSAIVVGTAPISVPYIMIMCKDEGENLNANGGGYPHEREFRKSDTD